MLENEPLAAVLTSESTNTQYLDQASIQIKWSDPTALGLIFIEVRSKDESNNSEASDWYIVDFGEDIKIIHENTDQELLILINSVQFTDMRLRIECSNPVGTISARLNARTVGA